MEESALARSAFIGRREELERLGKALDGAMAGGGLAVMLSGEAGIGKTRLVQAFKGLAAGRGVRVLSGAASQDSAKPNLAFSEALEGEIDTDVFEEREYTGFVKIFAINRAGMLVAQASSEETEMDADIFAGMLSAVQNFVQDSLGKNAGDGAGLGRLEYGDMKILIEHGRHLFLTGVFTGAEHHDMRRTLAHALNVIESTQAQTLEVWTGRMAEVRAVQVEIERLAGARFLVRRSLEGMKLDEERTRAADRVLERIRTLSMGMAMVIVLEDMHWSDEPSLFALNYLARNISGGPVLIVATARTGESPALDDAVGGMRSEGTIAELRLIGLGKALVAELVGDMFPGNDFPSSFIDSLSERCGGVPFFVVEYLRHMASEGLIAMDEGRHRLVDEALDIPDTVEGVVQSRLSRLQADALAIAEYASCIGREFGTDVAMSIRTVRDPGAALAEVQASGIIAFTGDRGSFCHALYQAVLYSSISARWKGAHHRTIGEYFESARGDRTDEAVYELAHHFGQTTEYEKAFRYGMDAGERAESSYAAEQAVRFYGGALSALAHLRERPSGAEADILFRIGNLCELTGEFERALESFARVSGMGGAMAAAAHMRMGEIHDATGDKRAAGELDKALELAGNAATPELARIYLAYGNLHQHKGDYDSAKKMYADALAIFGQAGSKREMGEALYRQAICHYYQGAYDVALGLLDRSLGHSGEAGNQRTKSNALNAIGAILKRRGETERALERYGESLSIMERLGDAMGMAKLHNNIGNIYFDRGEMDVTVQHYGKMLAIYRKTGHRRGIGDALNLLGTVAAEKGDLEKALGLFNQSLAIQESLGDPRTIGITVANIGMLNFMLGRFEEAEASQRRRLELSERISDKWGLMRGHGQLADALTELGRYDEAGDHVMESIRIAREVKIREAEGMAFTVLGTLEGRQGNWAKSVEAFEASLSILRQEENRTDIADALVSYGKTMKLKGDAVSAKRLLGEAMAIYGELGQKHKVEAMVKEISGL